MKKFEVWIPEKRVEVVKVLYTIEAESEEQVRDLMKEYEESELQFLKNRKTRSASPELIQENLKR